MTTNSDITVIEPAVIDQPRGVLSQTVPTDLLPNTSQLLRIGPPNELIYKCEEANRAALKLRPYWLYPTPAHPQYDWLRNANNEVTEYLFNVRVSHIELVLRESSSDDVVAEKLNCTIDAPEFSYTITCSIDSSFMRTLIVGINGLRESDGMDAPFHLKASCSKKTTAERFADDKPLAYYANLRIPGVKNENWLDNFHRDVELEESINSHFEQLKRAKGEVQKATHKESLRELLRDQVKRIQDAL